MEVLAIIQARMRSTRLPGKVLKKIGGRPVLHWVISQVKQAKEVDKIVVATTRQREDDQIENFVTKLGLPTFRGSTDDVLDRYYQAARKYPAKYILRVMGDCPFVNPEVLDRAITKIKDARGKLDFVGFDGDTFPDGLDFDLFTFAALEKCWEEAKALYQREHIGQYVTENPQKFKIDYLHSRINYHHLRLTLDEPEDLVFLRKLTRLVKPAAVVHLRDIIRVLKRRPGLLKVNVHIRRNEGLQKSLAKEKQLV